MALNARQVQEIERRFPSGISSRDILAVMREHDDPLSEATLRKYVQLGLLPRSRRVGEKGKHRGSRGLYPVEVISKLGEIRRRMAEGETLEDLSKDSGSVRALLGGMRSAFREVEEAARRQLDDAGLASRGKKKSDLTKLIRAFERWVHDLETWSAGLQSREEGKQRGHAVVGQSGQQRRNNRGSARTGRRGGT